jgi:2-isopropylmalate synthase
MSRRRIDIYDTTLRDGAQGEGISFSGGGKLKLARRLDAFGVDYIEGGFPGSNPKDMEFFREVKSCGLKRAQVVAFGSMRRAKMTAATDPLIQSLLDAETQVVTLYGKCWDLHVRDVLRVTPEQNLELIGDTIRLLREQGRTVMFDAEHFFDGYRARPEFALEVLRTVREAGASVLVLCDTNGGSLPSEVYGVTKEIVSAFDVPVGIHTHNDGGVGVANTLEAVRAGASHVQGTINGYGERCGNANLCTIIPNLELKLECETVGVDSLRQLRELSLYVDDLVNVRPDSKAPYVGSSAFGHKAGAHVDGVRKNPKTFEHVPPEAVGNDRRFLVSELSGGSSIVAKAIEMGAGRQVSPEVSREVLHALKELESRGYAFESADASFRMLVQKVLKQHTPFFSLEGFRVMVEKRGKDQPCLSEATVKVRVKDEVELTVSEGDGPVNALDGALRKALMRFYPEIAQVHLTDFRVRILDPEEATAATTRVLIESSDGTDTWGTVGVSENVIEASWEALVDSVEYKLFREEERRREAGA